MRIGGQPVDVAIRNLRQEFDSEILDRFYRDVLVPSFSPQELDSAEAIAAGLREGHEPETQVSVALGAQGDVLGGVVTERHSDSKVLLVGYVAVHPEHRGRGIGETLMRRVAGDWRADPGVGLAIGEVHDPRIWAGAKDDPVARLRFFERLGARILDVPFIQPALEPGGARVRGFLLISLYLDPAFSTSADSEHGVPSGALSRFVRRYYEDAEGAAMPGDPELTSLLGEIEREDSVRLLPIDEYDRVALPDSHE